MIGIATEVFDMFGSRIYERADKKDCLNDSGRRRCTRTATLDGGCIVYDTGYSVSDNIIKVRDENAGDDSVAFAKYIVQYYRSILVATKDGVFKGVPKSWNYDGNELEINVLVTEKISE